MLETHGPVEKFQRPASFGTVKSGAEVEMVWVPRSQVHGKAKAFLSGWGWGVFLGVSLGTLFSDAIVAALNGILN